MHPLLQAHREELLAIARRRGAANVRVFGSMARFDASTLVQDAVIRNLQTLAESSQRLSDSIKATEPGCPWRELAGFRNIVVHAYLALDLAIVWSIVEQDLPALAAAVQRMRARLDAAA